MGHRVLNLKFLLESKEPKQSVPEQSEQTEQLVQSEQLEHQQAEQIRQSEQLFWFGHHQSWLGWFTGSLDFFGRWCKRCLITRLITTRSRTLIGSRLMRRRAEKPSFFEVFFTITSPQIFLECPRVTDLYILTHFGLLYKTRSGGPCEPLCA